MVREKGGVTTAALTPLLLSVFVLAGAVSCRAQEATTASHGVFGNNGEDSAATPFFALNREAWTSATPDSPKADTTGADLGWHLGVAPYLWFPGMHGTASGPNGRGLSFRASPGDLLSNFRFGLMGAVEASRKRLVLTGDLLWVRLEDDRAVPNPGLLASSATMKASQFFLTPKVGLRVVNEKRIKMEAFTGIRYWHLGQNLHFNPSTLGLNFDGSQDFVDPLVGARLGVFLSPKVVVNIFGDVGGWDTGSHLEYQWVGTLGYRVKTRWTLHAGYRYLNIDKTADRGVVFNSTMAGVMFGVAIDMK